MNSHRKRLWIICLIVLALNIFNGCDSSDPEKEKLQQENEQLHSQTQNESFIIVVLGITLACVVIVVWFKRGKVIPPKKLANLDGAFFVIDGLNICRESGGNTKSFRIERLITLCIELRKSDASFVCFFDDDVEGISAKNANPLQFRAYKSLINCAGAYFFKVEGKADSRILKEAGENKWMVISNDRFTKRDNEHRDKYPWVLDPNRVFRCRINGKRLRVPTTSIDTNVRKLNKELINDLIELIYRQTDKQTTADGKQKKSL